MCNGQELTAFGQLTYNEKGDLLIKLGKQKAINVFYTNFNTQIFI